MGQVRARPAAWNPTEMPCKSRALFGGSKKDVWGGEEALVLRWTDLGCVLAGLPPRCVTLSQILYLSELSRPTHGMGGDGSLSGLL